MAVLGIIGCTIFLTGALAVVALGEELPAGGIVLAALATLVLDVLLVTALFRVLTARALTVRELWPGALIAGTSGYLLTLLGGLYVDRVVARASAIYGSFAAVIGLFAWISLLTQSFVIANLVNVVRVEHLWPRAMTGRELGEGDLRAIRLTTRRDAIASDARLERMGVVAPLDE